MSMHYEVLKTLLKKIVLELLSRVRASEDPLKAHLHDEE